jgi:uncharacterized protein DUF5916/cellulose/xylan binding protein with CBM9 domain
MNFKLKLLFAVICTTSILQVFPSNNKTYKTEKINDEIIIIDGIINDASWMTVNWGGDFVQQEPFEGEKPSHETKFKILYDERNVYFAFKCFDSSPDSIVQRMSRRDGFEGDWIEINIDSYNDKRTAFSFTLSASGVKGDEFITNDGDNWDSSWDPIWYGQAKIDNEGWTAEIAIPLSQLRYGNYEEQIWGLQFTRRLYRSEERSIWKYIPRDAPGWVSQFGELHGINGIEPQKQVEILPYTVLKTERFKKEPGDPYANTGKLSTVDAGLDGKIGLTSDITLDFTINPDFGQVEADPSEVNLSAFESYFQERRPFFIEGKNILNFQITGGDGGFSRDNLFYSRRIGSSPHHSPDVEDEEYIDEPNNTRIIGAAKITGKTKEGWSVGVLESVTAQEFAEIENEGTRRKEKVEPFTNYFLGRVQKDINKGNTQIGGIITSVNRKINAEQLEFIHKEAMTGGVDFKHQWKDKTYFFNFKSVFSDVKGTPEAILNTQESSRRYFQRPDASHVSIDTNRTSLVGTGGDIMVGKQANGRWRYALFLTYRSPGLELNDMGYLRKADQIMEAVWVSYRITDPFWIFRSLNINTNQWRGYNFEGVNIFDGGNVNFNAHFNNNWRFGTGFNVDGAGISTTELRGGPSIKYPGGFSNWFNIHTDHRQLFSFSFGGFNFWGNHDYSNNTNFWGGITVKPIDALKVSVSPSFNRREKRLQYVETVEFNDEDKFIMASLDQRTLSASIRINYNITPTLTVQYWGQPFISNGEYFDYKLITNPSSGNYEDRFEMFAVDQIFRNDDDETFDIDENLDGANDYSFDIPEFKFLEFRSNLVLRWEYTPGSTLFVVWNQGRSDSPAYDSFQLTQDMNDIVDIRPHNIFLLKFTYMFRY